MLNGDDNENGFKTNRSNKQKTNCTYSTLFLLISKNKFARAARFFVFPLSLFCTTTTLFCTTTTSNFLVTHYFYGIVVCAYPIFCFLCHVRFYFSLPLIFTLLAAHLRSLTLYCQMVQELLNWSQAIRENWLHPL